MTDAELAEYWKHQTIHWRNLAATYHQQLMASRNLAESHKGRTTTWADPTGNRAASNADRSKGKRP